MSAIPDDIMRAAQAALDRMPERYATMENGEFWARVEYETVSVILSERQRTDDRIEELERENAELRAKQPYVYIGRDGKPVLARVLEDKLVAAEHSLAECRREALEKAAKIADDYECHLMSYGGSVDAQHFYEGGMIDAGQGIAEAIRALSDSTPTPLQEQNANSGKEGEPSVNSVESED